MIEDEQQNKKIFMAPQLICSMNFRELNTEKDDYKKMLLKIRAILRKQIVASLNDEHIASKYIVIFDQLCCGTSLTEIAKRLHISKTRVSVLVEKLRRYPILRTLYSRLRVLASDI
jgi:DNA-binding NarL/FixJ family response regulator